MRDRRVEELQAEVHANGEQITAKDDLLTWKDREIATKEADIRVKDERSMKRNAWHAISYELPSDDDMR